MNRGSNWLFWVIGIVAVVFVLLLFIVPNSPLFGYIGHVVSETEVGVKIRGGEFVEVVSPGTYSDPFCWYCDIHDVSVTGFQFTVNDPEVLTLGAEQRIGVTVSGLAFRPGVGELTQDNWVDYRILYTDDNALNIRISELSKQAMKVCVGQKTFEEAAVGSTRNDLAVCIDNELSTMTESLFVDIRNIVVSDIQISEQAKAMLDALTQSQQNIELAKANEELAKADAERQLAVEQGIILVEQGREQELLRQRAISATLEEEAIIAEMAVIQAQADNERLQAQANLELAGIEKQIADLQALEGTARDRAIAQIYHEFPEYTNYLTMQLVSNALIGVEKIYLPTGTNPLVVIGDATPPSLIVPMETPIAPEATDIP